MFYKLKNKLKAIRYNGENSDNILKEFSIEPTEESRELLKSLVDSTLDLRPYVLKINEEILALSATRFEKLFVEDEDYKSRVLRAEVIDLLKANLGTNIEVVDLLGFGLGYDISIALKGEEIVRYSTTLTEFQFMLKIPDKESLSRGQVAFNIFKSKYLGAVDLGNTLGYARELVGIQDSSASGVFFDIFPLPY